MSLIERQFDVTYRHQVRFTEQVFSPGNLTLRDTLADEKTDRTHKALVVMDEALCRAQPGFAEHVKVYFDRHSDRLMNHSCPCSTTSVVVTSIANQTTQFSRHDRPLDRTVSHAMNITDLFSPLTSFV